MTDSEIRKAFADKVARNIFTPVVRHITGGDAQERLAEGIALTFETFQRYARRGVVLDDAVLVHHCRLRAVDLGRQLVKSGQRKRDLLDVRNFHEGRVQVLHLDGLPDEDGTFPGEEDLNVHAVLGDDLAQDPRRDLDSALDLARWLETLSRADQRILLERYQGRTLDEIARRRGVTISPIFARLRRLGLELARRAEVSLRDRARKRRAHGLGHGAPCPA